MFKQALSYLIIGGGCSGVAILSIIFSNNDNKRAGLWNQAARKASKITTISSYGDIDAYGLQNGCTFRILDKQEGKSYSLADFYTSRIKGFPKLEEEAVKIANNSKTYCGKDLSVVTFTYTPKPKFPISLPVEDSFKIEKTPIKT